MNRIKQLIIAMALTAGVGVFFMPAPQVAAINVFEKCTSVSSSSNPVCKDAANPNNSAASIAKVIVNTMLVILGILSVIMIVFSGIRYTISSGDASKVKGAKDTLTYSIVGLIVALLAWTIVNFVIDKF